MTVLIFNALTFANRSFNNECNDDYFLWTRRTVVAEKVMTPFKMKYLLLFCMLLLLSLGTIGNAFYRHNQYYPAIVYLTKSNASLTVVYFVASNLMWVIGYWMIMVFFGELRPNENEELWDRLKYIATETLMAFAIFRDDFSPYFAFLFAVLLYLKIIHWLGEERVDHLERSPIIPKLFHARILGLLVLLGILDLSFMSLAFNAINKTGPSPQIAFCFEYAILLPSVFYIVLKYILHTAEIHREAPLEDKTIILLYGQIAFDFIRIVLYFSYLAVMFRLYLLPAFAFRQIFNTMRNFTSALNDVISFRKAVRYMNTCCPSATQEELEATDSVCIVCREDMTAGAKKLPCNHIFHCGCLRSWFQRQQTCPTCRLKILNAAFTRVDGPELGQNLRNVLPQPNQRQDVFHNVGNVPSQPNQRQVDASQNVSGAPPVYKSNERCKDLSPCQCTSKCNLLLNSQEFKQCNNYSEKNFKRFSNTKDCTQASSSQSYKPASATPSQENITCNLSSQELLAVERDTRECIESHLKCLQHMSKMIDSTIVMMHQYCHVNTLDNIRSENQDTDSSNICVKELKDNTSKNRDENVNEFNVLDASNSLAVDAEHP